MKIGMMSFAHMHAHSYAKALKTMSGIELVGIFDEDEERGLGVAKQYDTTYFNSQTEFLAQDMDAVIICSENNRHKEMVVNAARADKDILCEKPIATNLKDAQEMIDVCEQEDVILQIAYPVRFSAVMQELKTKVEAGMVGEVLAFRTTNRGQAPDGWFIDQQQSGGGAVIDHTVHMVDIMRWLLGEEVVRVDAVVDSYFHNINVDDAGILTLEFENGVIASHDASWSRFSEYPTWGDATIEVIGTKDTIKVDIHKEHLRLYNPSHKSVTHVSVANNRDLGLLADFLECVQEQRQPSVTGYDGLKSLEVALAAYEASDSSQEVNL